MITSNSFTFKSLHISALRSIIGYIDDNVDQLCFFLSEKYLYDLAAQLFTPIYFDRREIGHYFNSFDLYYDALCTEESVRNDVLLPGDNENSNTPPTMMRHLFTYCIKRCKQHMMSMINGDEELQRLVASGLSIELDPSSTTDYLKIKCRSYITLEPGMLSESIVHLILHDSYVHPILPGTLPSRLQSLTFGTYFDQTLDDRALPPSLTSLTFGGHFKQELKPGTLPSTLTTLKFGVIYNKQLMADVLPSSLTSLTLGDDFNQILLPGTLPSRLKTLVIGHMFNQKINRDVLPNGLEYITFGDALNQSIEFLNLPPSIRQLKFGVDYDKPFPPNSLPPALTDLSLPSKQYITLKLKGLPASLTMLSLGGTYQVCEKSFPPTTNNMKTVILKKYKFSGDKFRRTLKSLPLMTRLHFDYLLPFPIQGDTFPNTLTHLSFGDSLNQDIAHAIPNTLNVIL
ncbi:hypothetical protein SAMD00019534_087130 [Acytostelium subglobosum LB1]|uniref:hypothetical protein n=1 Tax=Acytostelium subglobosum LB1 TaxID=1410327 RepID=UPI00064509C5|nr:hypothetical protein SAMD00019534_087130 [Acytostelium subglobosum LB1]GAM25538.1 hypothetical protein SAMD00019534_087130 [Acytostelium subglobosum LB1]|eukprot:XP_012751524.1 hypothetical protein SAMD00019534_087130 [Acytostelium subglobosum LB1]